MTGPEYNTQRMALQFERGDAERPRGHAFLYFTSGDDVYATYLVVLPIGIELAKYVPPMFASQIPREMGATASVIPLPPVPEKVESLGLLRALARARDDDLICGGAVSADPQHLLYAVTTQAQEYGAAYAVRTSQQASEHVEPEPELDPTLLMYKLMGERERLVELTKLSGMVRYALEGHDAVRLRDTRADLEKLASLLPEKYRPADLVQAICTPGAEGARLSELYIERCYKLIDEDYLALARIDQEIARVG